MRMEKKSDRRWRQRIRRDVLTSRAPTHPINALGARVISSFGISPSEEFSSERLVQKLSKLALLISLARDFSRV